LLRLGARRQVTYQLRYNEHSTHKFQILFGVDSFPHGDTLNDLYVQLCPEQVQESVSAMTETLIRKKVLYPYRLLDTYFVVVIDATGTLSFDERYCPHCLTQTHGNKTVYYHNVLEAKLVSATGLTFSLMTEFIENPEESPSKQDCELKAFHRLKARFPHLPVYLSLDGLYAEGPVFDLCQRYGWRYMVVLTERDLPSVNGEFHALQRFQQDNHFRYRTGNKLEIHQEYRWVNNISYLDSEKREHNLSVLECLETKPDKADETQTTCFKWIINFHITQESIFAPQIPQRHNP
jgi:hypothetical protein